MRSPTIRLLESDDLPSYKRLRLVALQESPKAFTADFAEEVNLSDEDFLFRICPKNEPLTGVFGAFDVDGNLVGMLAFNREDGLRRRHCGKIWGVYVASRDRGQGIATRLLDGALSHAKDIGLRQVTLVVVDGNHPARKLYVSRGFVPFGLHPAELSLDGEFLDVEYFICFLNKSVPAAHN